MNRFALLPLLVLAVLPLWSVGAEALASSPLDEAQAALKANDPMKAAALLEPLAGPDGKDAAVFCALSQVRLAQRKFAEAVTLAEKATMLDPTKAAYFSQLGVALGQRMGELSFMEQAALSGKLKKAFAKAVELDPNDIPGLIGLARFYSLAPEIAGGSVEKAKEFAARLLKIEPFLGEFELGNIAEHDDNAAEALGHFEAAAKLRPRHAGVQNLCGRMLAKLGRKDEARARFAAALKLSPEFEEAKKNLAALDAPAP